jgi:hypothetical protein
VDVPMNLLLMTIFGLAALALLTIIVSILFDIGEELAIGQPDERGALPSDDV